MFIGVKFKIIILKKLEILDLTVSPRYRLHIPSFPAIAPITFLHFLYTLNQDNMATQILIKNTMTIKKISL